MADPSTSKSAPPSESPGQGILQGVARHSMVYAFGMIVARAVSFLMLPIYTRYLTPADYGVMALVEMTLDFIAIIAGAKLALGVFRYYHKAETEREQEEVVSTSFILVAGMYSAVGLATFLAAPALSRLVFESVENTILFQIAAMNVGLGALMIVPFSFARVKDRSTLFVGMTLLKLALQVSAVIWFLVVMDLGVLGVFLGTLVANFFVGGGMTLWLFRNVRLSWTAKATRDLLRYGLPLMATNVATFATAFSDRYFLQATANETVVGLYNLAYQFGFLLVMIGFGPINQVWGPKRFQVSKEPNAHAILSRGFVLINVVLLSVAVGITIFVDDLLRIMATPAFRPAAQVVPLILVAYVLQTWGQVQDIGILIREKTRYVALANFAAAGVALAGYFLFIPRFQEWGAAGVTVLAFSVQFGLIYWFSQKLWPVRYAWSPVLVLVGWAVAISVMSLLLPELPIVTSVGVRSVLGVTFLVGIWLLPILEPEDKRAAREWSTRARNFCLRLMRG